MRVIELDARNWADILDFYNALKTTLGSCKGHGNSPDAWVDSMIYGGMNQVETPYVIRVSGTAFCSSALQGEIKLLSDVIRDARAWRLQHYGDDVNVSIQIAP